MVIRGQNFAQITMVIVRQSLAQITVVLWAKFGSDNRGYLGINLPAKTAVILANIWLR